MIKIRPHHGMCLFFFQGKGYNNTFTRNMEEMKTILSKNPMIRLVNGTDDICLVCPNSAGNVCSSCEKVARYDIAVLKCCGLKPGQDMPFLDFQDLVREKILDTGERLHICGDCQWNELCR